MSISYTDLTLLAYGVVTTPTGGDIVGKIPCLTYAFMVTDVLVCVQTAGAQTASLLRLRTDAGSPVTIAEVATATSAARTSLHTVVTEANRPIAAGTSLELAHITTDASAVYWYQVWGTYNFC